MRKDIIPQKTSFKNELQMNGAASKESLRSNEHEGPTERIKKSFQERIDFRMTELTLLQHEISTLKEKLDK